MLKVAPVTVRRDRLFVNMHYKEIENAVPVTAMIPAAKANQIAVAPDTITAQTSCGTKTMVGAGKRKYTMAAVLYTTRNHA